MSLNSKGIKHSCAEDDFSTTRKVQDVTDELNWSDDEPSSVVLPDGDLFDEFMSSGYRPSSVVLPDVELLDELVFFG